MPLLGDDRNRYDIQTMGRILERYFEEGLVVRDSAMGLIWSGPPMRTWTVPGDEEDETGSISARPKTQH